VSTADNLVTYMCRSSRNSGSLNFLEPSRPVQACKEAGLFLHLAEGRLDGRTVFRGVTLCRSAQRIQKPSGVFRGGGGGGGPANKRNNGKDYFFIFKKNKQ